MQRIAHDIKDRDSWLALRRRNLNSTEIAALFGLSPYQTALELALTKDGKIDEVDVDGERTAWGTRLQDAIAGGVADDYGVYVQRLDKYIELADGERIGIGSSFDFEICGVNYKTGECTDPSNELPEFYEKHGDGMLEIKNVDGRIFANDWSWIDGQLEAAPHIEIQLQHQLLARGLKWGAIAVLVGGNTLKVLVRLADEYFAQRIVEVSRQFWSDLKQGLYPPAIMPADAGVLCKLYSHAEPGKFYDGTSDDVLRMACQRYNLAGIDEGKAHDAKETAKAEILQIMQDHEKGVAPGYKISTWMQAPTQIEAYEKAGFRGFRVTKIKVKKEKAA